MYDVVISGAGPSGAATAARLAALGLRVLLIDRAPFPRYKPCAGGVDGAAARALRDLGVDPSPVVEAAPTAF
jgi:flavin-dependent dehydrogenase